MPLKLLLDENISHEAAAQVKRSRVEIAIESALLWQRGAYRGVSDRLLLQAAHIDRLTLVTYDLKTIPDLLAHK